MWDLTSAPSRDSASSLTHRPEPALIPYITARTYRRHDIVRFGHRRCLPARLTARFCFGSSPPKRPREGERKTASISRSKRLAIETFTSGCKFSTQTGNKLEGKIAIITGAATGIGKAAATKFINNGAKVVIADIQHQLGQETANELGPNADFVNCDVTKELDIIKAIDFTISKHNQLDVMYNNAGVACKSPPSVVDLDLELFDKVMNINVRGMIAGIKHASRVMIPRRSGSILCTASVTGLMGGLAQHTYSISKAGVIGIVRTVTSELRQYGIRVNCISPFAVPTEFVMEEMRVMYPGFDDQRLMEMVRNIGSLDGAVCEASDIANAALFLASDDAKYISGHNLVVDGGFASFKNLNLPLPNKL